MSDALVAVSRSIAAVNDFKAALALADAISAAATKSESTSAIA
jgi:hypothetical protein